MLNPHKTNPMNRLLLLIFTLIITSSVGAQDLYSEEDFPEKKKYQEVAGDVYDEKMLPVTPDAYPAYPKGKDGIKKHIIKNYKYPDKAKSQKIKGKVVVQFYVGKDGYVKDIIVARKVHPLLDEEAVRIIKLMERWRPGHKDGKTIDVKYFQMISFGS